MSTGSTSGVPSDMQQFLQSYLQSLPQGVAGMPRSADTQDVWLPLSTFLQLTLSATREHREELYQQEQASFLLNSQFFRSIAQTNFATVEQINLAASQLAAWQNVYNAQQQQITHIQQYNTQLQAATTTLNSVIDRYNHGTATGAELDQAVSDYNSAASSLDAQYNGTVSGYNNAMSAIPGINATFISQNLTFQLPSQPDATTVNAPQSTASSSQSPPINTLPSPITGISLQTTIPAAPTNPQDIINIFFPLLANLIASNSHAQDVLALHSALKSLNGLPNPFLQDVTLPNSYISRIPPEFLKTNAGGDIPAGSGVWQNVSATGLGSRYLSGVNGDAIYKAVLQQFIMEGPLDPGSSGPSGKATGSDFSGGVDLLQHIGLNIVAETAFLAGIVSAKQNASDSVVAANPEAANVVSTLAFANGIASYLSESSFSTNVSRFVASNPLFASLSPDDKQELAAALTAVLKTSVLGITLSQIALALNIPGLTAQILGNLLGQASNANEAGAINAALANPLNVADIKNGLQINLTPLVNIAVNIVKSLINKAVNQALSENKSFQNAQAFQEAVTRAFIESKNPAINPALAAQLGATAKSLLQAQLIPGLDQPFITDSLNGLTATAVRNRSSAVPGGSSAVSSLVASELDNPTIAAVVASLSTEQFDTNRDMRGAMVNSLIGAGMPIEESMLFSNALVEYFQPSALPPPVGLTPEEVAFLSTSPTRILPSEELASQLVDHVVNQVGPVIGNARAKSLADQYVNVLFGSNSIMMQLKDQVTTLKQTHQDEALNALRETTVPLLTTPSPAPHLLKHKIDRILNLQVPVPTYLNPIAQADLGTSMSTGQPTTFHNPMGNLKI